MLNKEVCKKCCNDFRIDWTKYDEKRWKKGKIFCNSLFQKNVASKCTISNKVIPPFCFCGLEHLVANRQEEIDKKELVDAK